MGSCWGDGTILCINYGGNYTSVYICQNSKIYNIERMDFMVCKCKTEFLGEGGAC